MTPGTSLPHTPAGKIIGLEHEHIFKKKIPARRNMMRRQQINMVIS